jgi:ribonuclease I|tara:strand:+ start:349 stop:789 length:441 start_codon:yes stop_codon:yes gene_type:complete
MFFGISKALFDSYITSDTRFYYLSLIRESEYSEFGWGIHGLWPQYSQNSYPSFCKDVDFSIDALKPIMPELKEYWHSDMEPDADFWSHEYKKHGSCVFKPMTELAYFNTALDLFHKAVKLGLPNKYYNKKTGKCLIPVNLDFTFRN